MFDEIIAVLWEQDCIDYPHSINLDYPKYTIEGVLMEILDNLQRSLPYRKFHIACDIIEELQKALETDGYMSWGKMLDLAESYECEEE